MAGFDPIKVAAVSTTVSGVAAGTAVNKSFDARVDEAFALPGFHLINRAVNFFKEAINDGQGLSWKKAGAYLGFRLITYSGLPLIVNFISAIVSGLLALFTLPTRCCNESINQWCWERFKGSLSHTVQSLFDLTCDFRMLTGICCCAPDSAYLRV